MHDQPDPFITAVELKSLISNHDVKILDATWIPSFSDIEQTGQELFIKGHIEGAQFFDIDAFADSESSLPHMMPSSDKFTHLAQQLGLNSSDHIILYDQNRYFASARAWWMFRVMGHSNVSVMDGGLNAWNKANGETTTSASAQLSKGNFQARVDASLVSSLKKISQAPGAVCILDARPEGRFNGTSPEPRPGLKCGHIPSSKNLPASSLINNDGTFISADAIREKFKQNLIVPNREDIITSCGSGVSAALINLALARIGNWSASLYDGSWAEWGASDQAVAIL